MKNTSQSHSSQWKSFLFAAVAVAFASVASANSSIGVKFANGVTTGSQNTSDPLLVTEVAGAPGVAQTNWNLPAGARFNNIVLYDNTGMATTVTLNGAGDGTYFSKGLTSASLPGDQSLGNGELYDQHGSYNSFVSGSHSSILTFSNIPYAQYDVYAYVISDAAGRYETVGVSSGTTFDFNTASFASLKTMSDGSEWIEATSTWNGTGSGPTIASANYVHFTGLTSSDFTLTWDAMGNGSLSAVQIVATSVPEPSACAMLLAGVGMLLWLQRSRNREGMGAV